MEGDILSDPAELPNWDEILAKEDSHVHNLIIEQVFNQDSVHIDKLKKELLLDLLEKDYYVCNQLQNFTKSYETKRQNEKMQ